VSRTKPFQQDRISSQIVKKINQKPQIKEYVRAANKNFEMAKVGRGQTAITTMRKKVVTGAM
jgi:hypothetical protein